jgi:hypothetical protein
LSGRNLNLHLAAFWRFRTATITATVLLPRSAVYTFFSE